MSVAGDIALTENRAEHKYLVDLAQVPRLVAALDDALCPHHHAADSPVAPMTQHYTTTVYFDTPDGALFRVAKERANHTKLRAREYYDVLPLAELATDEAELLRSSPVLWLELKDRAGDQTGKQRAGVPKRRLHEFLARRSRDPELRAIQAQTYGDRGEDVLERVVAFLDSFDEPLSPSCIVNYRRLAWQDPKGSVRVTLDQDLCSYAPRDSLWTQERPLTRTVLGTPVAVAQHAIVEVKRRGGFPEWLSQLLTAAAARPSHVSKFVLASEAVHAGRQDRGTQQHGDTPAAAVRGPAV